MAAPESTQARQAALLLHSLPPAVRRQVLARLDAVESARLKSLLDELAKLGVSQTLGRQLQHLMKPSPVAASPPNATVLSAQDRAERLNAADVARCLQTCAPMTVAKLFRARTWPWQSQVLEAMPDARRFEILDCMRSESPPLAPAMLRTLCERLCTEAAVGVGVRESPIPSPQLLQRVAARLQRLFRWTR